jgi:hypothetical protein
MYRPDEDGPPYTDYTCVCAVSVEELNEEMSKSLRDGWQPFGDLVVIQSEKGILLYQCLVELREWPI